MSKQIVMCPPTNFGIFYSINPWMQGNIASVDPFKAAQQWSELRNALVEADADVIVSTTPPEDCPDAVFMANAGVVYENIFIPSRFKHVERQVEQPYFEKWFVDHKFELRTENSTVSFEGAGDALFNKNRSILWMGFGVRSGGDYKFVLDRLLEDTDVIVRPLQLVDPRFYHLDTCFCPLDTGELLWYPPAFSEHAQAVIELWYKDKMIKVSEADALRFACNAVSICGTIILPEVSYSLYSKLEERGYTISMVDMSQFLRSGGACKCLTLELVT